MMALNIFSLSVQSKSYPMEPDSSAPCAVSVSLSLTVAISRLSICCYLCFEGILTWAIFVLKMREVSSLKISMTTNSR